MMNKNHENNHGQNLEEHHDDENDLESDHTSSCNTIQALPVKGILLVNKPKNKTSFSLVGSLRRLLKVKKIGHAGTLDPFATGVMVMLIGKEYTKLSDTFLCNDKEYIATLHLGIETDSYDCDGEIVNRNEKVPTLDEIMKELNKFQGTISQTPPMFSAKKIGGKKLYELARQGITIERKPAIVTVKTTFIDYAYPYLKLNIECSKGTYIRSIAHDLGLALGCYAHLIELTRTRSGKFHLDSCYDGSLLDKSNCCITTLKKSLIE